MNNPSKRQHQKSVAGLLALTLVVTQIPFAAFAEDFSGAPINSINTGSNFTGGNYLNTAGNQTIFRNPGGAMRVTGNYNFKESDMGGNLTGNGGAALFQARTAVFDGARLDARGIMQNGRYVGNGGKITVQADLFYSKNSDIMVGGRNGGMFTASVGNFFAENTRIDATGNDGHGGTIKINASGTVNVDDKSNFDVTQTGTLLDASGNLIGTYDPGLIDITGSAVNIDGILKADAASAAAGGKINLVATGSAETCVDCDADYAVSKGTLSKADRDKLVAINKNLKDLHNGSVRIGSTAKLTANGLNGVGVAADGYILRAANGGFVDITAVKDIKIEQGAHVQANGGQGDKAGVLLSGGDGGFIKLNAQHKVTNKGNVTADGGDGVNQQFDLGAPHQWSKHTAGGNGGNGGVIVVSAYQAENTGLISAKGGYGGNGGNALAYAQDNQTYSYLNAEAVANANAANGYNGGHGGLVVFNTPANPTNTGTIDVRGGNGGNGGNAAAFADAYSQYGDANAEANAIAGNGGYAGNGGTIVVKNPGQLQGTIKLNGGQGGRAGFADAEANANAWNYASSNAYARGNSEKANADDAARANSTSYYNPTGAYANAKWEPGINRPNGQVGKVDALRPVEIVSHQGQAIVLNNGVTGNNTLQGLIGVANVRDTKNQLGGAPYVTNNINSIHVGDIASTDLTLATGAISSIYPAAKHVVINTKGNLTNNDAMTTNSVWLLSGGQVKNTANIVTADSVNISAQTGVLNGALISSGTTARGGSVIINNAQGLVRNTGVIAADSTQYGGRVDIVSPGVENVNGGRISADAIVCDAGGNCTGINNAMGGQVVIRGVDIHNHGVISASQINPPAGQGVGGEIRLYGDNSVFNSKTGLIKAVGSNEGGDIKLASSGSTGAGFSNTPVDGVVFFNGVYPTGNNPVAGRLTPNKPGVVINEGTITAVACESCGVGKDGSITLVGDNGVVLMQDSYLNKVKIDAKTLLGAAYGNPAVVNDPTVAANIKALISSLNQNGAKLLIAAGQGATRRIICLHDPRNPNPPVTPDPPDGPDIGNFLRGRDPFDTTPRVGLPTPVAVSNCGLFLATSFQAVTKDILSRSYNVLRNAGPQQAIEYLMQSGMSCCAAGELANRLQNGQMNLGDAQANQSVANLLTVIAGTCSTQPCGSACSTGSGADGGGCCSGGCSSTSGSSLLQ